MIKRERSLINSLVNNFRTVLYMVYHGARCLFASQLSGQLVICQSNFIVNQDNYIVLQATNDNPLLGETFVTPLPVVEACYIGIHG